MVVRNSLLALVLTVTACGRVHHDKGNAANAGTGGTDGTAGGTAAGATAGAAGAAEPDSCLYPVRGVEPGAPADKGHQSFVLSSPFPIDVAPAVWGELAASYDFNGDQVSDLIYRDEAATPPRFRLALTNLPPNVFDFQDSGCAELDKLPDGRLLLRDLNGDGVPDFIVGTTLGAQAFVNHRTGLEKVLDYAFVQPTVRVSVINVGVGHLNDDGLSDLVVGFDRLRSEQGFSYELGAVAFMQDRSGQLSEGSQILTLFANGQQQTTPFYSSYLAVGNFAAPNETSALLVGSSFSANGHDFGFLTRFETLTPPEPPVDELTDDVHHVFTLPIADGHDDVLAVGYRGFWVVDLSVQPPHVVATGALVFDTGPSHEAGGGSESPRYFVFDIDHDGDLDFLERSPMADQLAVHLNLGKTGFDAPQVFDVSVRGDAETSFIHIGPGGGIVGYADPTSDAPAVYTLFPAPK